MKNILAAVAVFVDAGSPPWPELTVFPGSLINLSET